MVKKELKIFKLDFGADNGLSAIMPASVFSVFSDSGISPSSNATRARFYTTLHIDNIDAARSYVLRFSGLTRGGVILINGNTVGESEDREVILLDVKSSLTVGDNLLEIIFDGENDTLLASGVFGAAELLSFGGAIIERVSVTQSFDSGAVTLGIKVGLYGRADNTRAVATLVSSAGQVYYAGLTRGKGNIIIKEPLYWWPRGLGIQSLYKLTVNLYGDSEVEDTKEIRIGIRRITTANNADGSTLEISGVEFLPMGAVYEPSLDLSPAETKRRNEWIVSSAHRAGFNSLVIPKGADILPDSFYELCDVSGIVVIHELSPSVENAARLLSERGNHASFGPVDIIGESESIDKTCERLREIIPELDFAQYDNREDYPSYATLPCDKTLRANIADGDDNIFSERLETLAGEHILSELANISKTQLYPKNLSDLAYTSRLLASDRIKTQIIEKRLKRGALGRAVFSSVSSPDAFVSHSSIDSLGKWKALQYSAAKFFAPTVIFAERDGARIGFSISNERRLAFIGDIEYRVLDNKNNLIFKGTRNADITEMSARKVFTEDLSEIIAGHEREYYLEYTLREGTSIVYRDTLLFVREKEFKLADPKIKCEIVGEERRFAITLSASAFAKCVEIEFDGFDAILADNCFDITSSAPQKISFNLLGAPTSAEMLMKVVKIRSLYDVGR